MDITVREAIEDDAVAMGRLHVQAWQVAYRGMIADDFLDELSIDERVEEWRQILRGEVPVGDLPFPTNLVSEQDGVVVGFANVGAFRQAADGAPEVGINGGEPGELWAMYVDPEHWGSGAGSALMTATMNELRAKQYNPAFLWVLTENQRARQFYERQGWVCDGLTIDAEIDGLKVSEIRYSCAVD